MILKENKKKPINIILRIGAVSLGFISNKLLNFIVCNEKMYQLQE